jgi:prophage tail gpP-like protein
MGRVALKIGGRTLTGWSSITISSSLAAAAATLAVSGEGLPRRSLNHTELVTVTYDGQLAFSGYLDEISVDVSSQGRRVRASGRSPIADLVDSTIDREAAPEESEGENFILLVRRYLDRSGLAIELDGSRIDPPIPVIPRHAPSIGETYWASIERMSRVAGVICTSTASGALALISPSRFDREPVALVEGQNVLSLRARASWADRAHRVIAEGQGSGLGDNWEDDIALRAVATDEAVRASRTSVVQVEGAATQEELEARARWEVAVRAARGSAYSAVVPGWRMPSSSRLWATGSLISLDAPSLEFRGDLLVDQVEFRFAQGGETTNVSLVRRDAYRAEPRTAAENEPTAGLAGAGGGW